MSSAWWFREREGEVERKRERCITYSYNCKEEKCFGGDVGHICLPPVKAPFLLIQISSKDFCQLLVFSSEKKTHKHIEIFLVLVNERYPINKLTNHTFSTLKEPPPRQAPFRSNSRSLMADLPPLSPFRNFCMNIYHHEWRPNWESWTMSLNFKNYSIPKRSYQIGIVLYYD